METLEEVMQIIHYNQIDDYLGDCKEYRFLKSLDNSILELARRLVDLEMEREEESSENVINFIEFITQSTRAYIRWLNVVIFAKDTKETLQTSIIPPF